MDAVLNWIMPIDSGYHGIAKHKFWGLRGKRNSEEFWWIPVLFKLCFRLTSSLFFLWADNEAQMQPECVEHLKPVSLTFCPFTPLVPAAPGWPCGGTPLLMTLMQQCGKCHSGGKIHTGSPFSPFSTAAPIPPCEWREQIGDSDRQPRHGSNRQRSGQISRNVQLFLIMQQITAQLCCDMQRNEKLQPLLHCSIFHHFPTKPIPRAAKRWHLMTAAELQGGHLIRPLSFMSGWKANVHVLVETVLRRTGGNFPKCSADSHTAFLTFLITGYYSICSAGVLRIIKLTHAKHQAWYHISWQILWSWNSFFFFFLVLVFFLSPLKGSHAPQKTTKGRQKPSAVCGPDEYFRRCFRDSCTSVCQSSLAAPGLSQTLVAVPSQRVSQLILPASGHDSFFCKLTLLLS